MTLSEGPAPLRSASASGSDGPAPLRSASGSDGPAPLRSASGSDGPAPLRSASGIDHLLARARAHLERLGPSEAAAAVEAGARLVDIRPGWQRRDEGTLPGALVIERNHLEWRLDPTSDARIAEATDHDRQWIVICSEGYTSSLAAAALQELGLHRATDVVGGFRAWAAVGLPTAPGSDAPPDYAVTATVRH